MKSTKLLLAVLIVSLFGACSNRNEYVYNERAAGTYHAASEEFEFHYKKFKDGKIKTKY
jgi:uncharacterized lipoprotein